MRFSSLALALLLGAWGCKSVPEGRVGVASIRFEGNRQFSDSDLTERIATEETPKFLGLFRASWRRYEDFEPEILDKDLQRIEHYYRRHGYYETHVRAGRVTRQGKFVDVEILIDESEPVRVRAMAVVGVESLPQTEGQRVRESIVLQVRDVFDQDKLAASTKAISSVLANLGYAYAEVTPRAQVDLGPRAADVTFQVDPGVPCKVGPVTFEGLGDLPENLVRRSFGVTPGEPYSQDELEAGRRALIDLGVFAAVDVAPDLSTRNRADVPIRVVLTRSALRGFRLGGGLLVDFTRTDIHGLIGWEHRNFLGGMRHFSVEDRPALILFPTALSRINGPSRILPANSFRTTLSQPAFPEARTTSTVRFEYNVYPIIISPVDPNQQVFPGYHEIRALIGPDRYFPSWSFRGGIIYNLQANFPFTYAGPLNPAFNRILASYIDLKGQFDLRDDPVSPTQGFLLQNSLQFAGGIFGGDAQDVRLRPEMRMYVPVSRSVTLAGRAVLGLLWAHNYGATLQENFLAIPNEAAAAPYIHDLQITYFRGFFSGGADSNRGYGFREIGPHNVNPLIIPGSLAEEQARCNPANPLYSEQLCLVATGGLTLWEASVELRTPFIGDLGSVIFVDASDVSPNELDVRLYVPHLSVGFGLRYPTPVGPARVDLGFRIPGAQRIGGQPNPVTDGPVPSTFLGLPIALSIGLGEAY
jgi:outer membrane protein insertion porin family/translocation and assembly module TamA